MKKVLFFTVFIINLVLLNSCSSAPNSVNKTVDNRISNSNNAQNPQINPDANSLNVNANVQNTDVNQQNVPFDRKIEKNSNVKQNPSEKAKIIFVPAGNNSEIGTTMGEDGEFLEVRVFKSDKNLQKTIRKVIAKKITVYLKNGKTIEIDESQISGHSTASPEEILIAAGVLQKPDSSQMGGK